MTFERASGILLHPTSLPSPYGIGDLGSDAYKFVDFLEKSGQKLWQILPLGPTGYGNSPYASYSAFAGNTTLISPELLVKQGFLSQEEIGEVPVFSDSKVNYPEVFEFKNKLLKMAFENFKNNVSEQETAHFFHFCNTNKYWLHDFAMFMALKDHFDAKAKKEGKENEPRTWANWDEGIVARNPAVLDQIDHQLGNEIFYHQFLQYEFFKQWGELKKYANSKGISLIGDIPIFVAYDSADAWSNPEIFHLDSKGHPIEVAGVPPDYFSETGQLWGNPLYNWEVLEKRDFDWWITRFKNMLNMVDIIRVDHFRGFESYWAVPYGAENAIKGKWKKAPGMKLFATVNDVLGQLPIVAEDLGIITPEVEELRDTFEFPGMKILQFAFTNDATDKFLPHNHVKNCVVYPGTHDNDTCLGWFKTAPEKETEYFKRYAGSNGENIHLDFLRLGMSSIADTALFALQDLFGLDTECRMNMPSKPDGNWEWRFTHKDLTAELALKLKTMTKDYGR
jgi:4-alpha-glucanotransferase